VNTLYNLIFQNKFFNWTRKFWQIKFAKFSPSKFLSHTVLHILYISVLLTLDKCTCSSNTIVSLRDPHTGEMLLRYVAYILSVGEGRKYLLVCDEQNHRVTMICEILMFSEKPCSWFVGETVQKGIYI